jgi:hydroxymethylpyrimidine/phosphomethylpyrimidine kinase
METPMNRLLIIAGSDSGGGAGIQADIKTATCFGVFATTAITALTAQNTLGVQGIFDVPPAFIAQQIQSVLNDIGTDAIKTGMLHSRAVIETVVTSLQEYAPNAPLVVDPVMVAKGGAKLLQPDAIDTLKNLLLPRATLVTPNIPEAEILSGMKISTPQDMQTAGERILRLGCQAVLMKGGHLEDETLVDYLIMLTRLEKQKAGPLLAQGIRPVSAYSERIPSEGWSPEITRTMQQTDNTHYETHTFTAQKNPTRHTHGTGCTYAAAIAAGLAQRLPLKQAVTQAHAFVQRAIKNAPNLGQGQGPLGHFYSCSSLVPLRACPETNA